MIVHVDGVQGSGKSYICSHINNALCIDTDDIMKEAIDIIETSQGTDKRIPRTFHQLSKIKSQLADEIIKQHPDDIIVFVGMTVNIKNPKYKLFIKITEPSEVYRRLILREMYKIIKSENKIKKHLNDEKNPKEYDIHRIADLSIKFPVDYQEFIDDYRERLQESKKKGYTPKTQDEIIDFINGLSCK
mgnify:CR=1 FL=1